MKAIIYFVVFLTSISILLSAEYEQNTITVKFSKEFANLIINQNIDEIGEFSKLLGSHKLTTFVNPILLANLNKKKDENLLLSNNDFGLERIYKINYKNSTDPLYAASKISGYDFVEYAEPVYKRFISDTVPNDSLFESQYYLNSIKALDAWKFADTAGKQVVISVVDTGVDYLHEDLKGILYINPGEDGFDEQGNDKRTNGIDDDGNGFIDDYMGWDFGADDKESGFDNDAFPGNPHGTHVAGIIAAIKNNFIGIAGTGLNTKILPVKIGANDPASRSLRNSYDGLLYAAIAGADIINCSWGGGGFSQAEQDIVNQVVDLGSLVVAAAGNDYSPVAFFPAAYRGVISVAAIDFRDLKANFSNYHSSVDVSAPGVDIMSTVPENAYVAWNGTSMASPVAAAVAGLIKMNYPHYNNIQIGEHLKATAENIDEKNPGFGGQLGSGKVDALAALTSEYPVSISLYDYEIIEEIPDGVIKSGEKVDVKIKLFNALNPVSNVRVFATSPAFNQPSFINEELVAGDLGEYEVKEIEGTISLRVTEQMIVNFNMPLTLRFVPELGGIFSTTINIFVNPSWRTMKQNNISLTYTSQGNLAYDDFPNNNRGEGFSYLESPNILFEGALMIAYSHELLSNVARGSSGSAKNRDFVIGTPIISENPGKIATEETYTEFASREDSLIAPVKVIQTGYQFKGNQKDDVIYVVYDIINTTEQFQDSVYAGLYFDWDIGTSGSNNRSIWNKSGNFAYNLNVVENSYPLSGIKLISQFPVNYFAIDNDGNTEENPGVYDGFTKEEKWRMLTGGIGRDSSNITDASMVIGAGPIRLRAGDTARVAFALFAAWDLEQLEKTASQIPVISGNINPNGSFASKPKRNDINLIFPNPASHYSTIELFVNEIEIGELNLWDINGKKIKEIFKYNSSKNDKLYPGIIRIEADLRDLSQGQYFLRFSTNRGESNEILNIVR